MSRSKTRRVNVNKEEYDIAVHRPSKWGNPFRIGPDGTRRQVLLKYRQHVLDSPNLMAQLHRLYGRRLGCFCDYGQDCHGDILVELAEQDHKGRKLKPTGLLGRHRQKP